MGHSIFSPYYRINVKKTGLATKISVDKAFFQHILNFAELTRLPEGKQKQNLEEAKHRYDLPYGLNGTQTDVLVLGAGTGNDVQSAIRNKAGSVTAVEIDPVIIKLGKELHPQEPYQSKKVKVINDDARAFLKQNTDTHYDLITYGLLDSHSMFSSVSSLRLDNFVYTKEGIRDAFKLLKPDGTLHISFWSKNYPWITERIYWTITKATGTEPIVYVQNASDSVSFFVNKNPRLHSELNLKESYMSFRKIKIGQETSNVRISNDNWPFLYLKKDSLPITYLLILVLILIFGAFTTNLILPKGTMLSSFDWPIFLMGVGFMLLETRSITALSLIFGSTWLVNAFVFIGILMLALIANLYTKFLAVKSYTTYYYLLFISLILMWFLDIGFLNNFDLITRGCMAALIMGLPIGIAGVIVSKYLSESKDASLSLAANTLGAVLGVCLEYFSMIFGLQFLLVIAFLIYLGSFILHKSK